MSKPFSPKVITGNALLEGDVVYLSASDTWERELSQADVITDAATADLRLLLAHSQAHEVVGAYLADVAVVDGTPTPTHFRETFRARGPSNHAHGKQEFSPQAELN